MPALTKLALWGADVPHGWWFRLSALGRRECPGDVKRAWRDRKTWQPVRACCASPREVRTKRARKSVVRLGAGLGNEAM